MLTPFVVALAFANSAAVGCAYPYSVLIGALQNAEDQNFFPAEVLTLREHIPTRFAGWAGGAGRPLDIDELSKEELHELPSAA